MLRIASVLVAIWAGTQSVDAYGEMNKFLIVSSSSTHQIAYAPIPQAQDGWDQEKRQGDLKLRTLISDGLTFPQGIAVDAWRRHLYVADPSLNELVFYKLNPSGPDRLNVGAQQVAAKGVEVRWVAVDDLGNVFFTVESTHRIMRITAENIDRGSTQAEVVFDGNKNNMVNAPGGIAIDNYFAWWSNKLDPDKAGTIVQSLHSEGSDTKKLLNFNAKTYGVCAAVNNIFFTDETKNLYGIPRLGGISEPVKVSQGFEEARGCAWDGANTVYVADKKKNAVYQFPAAMPILRQDIPVDLTAYMEGAFGVAVYTVSQAGGALGLFPSLLASGVLPVLAALLTVSASLP